MPSIYITPLLCHFPFFSGFFFLLFFFHSVFLRLTIHPRIQNSRYTTPITEIKEAAFIFVGSALKPPFFRICFRLSVCPAVLPPFSSFFFSADFSSELPFFIFLLFPFFLFLSFSPFLPYFFAASSDFSATLSPCVLSVVFVSFEEVLFIFFSIPSPSSTLSF